MAEVCRLQDHQGKRDETATNNDHLARHGNTRMVGDRDARLTTMLPPVCCRIAAGRLHRPLFRTARDNVMQQGTTHCRERGSMPTKQDKPEQVKSLEATLWEAADRLPEPRRRRRVQARCTWIDLSGKYVSDVFAKRREALERLVDDPDSDYYMPSNDAKASVLEDRDEYASEGVFWVPEAHRWDDLRKTAKQTDIGERIDAAMDAIEKENPSLRGVLREEVCTARADPGDAW